MPRRRTPASPDPRDPDRGTGDGPAPPARLSTSLHSDPAPSGEGRDGRWEPATDGRDAASAAPAAREWRWPDSGREARAARRPRPGRSPADPSGPGATRARDPGDAGRDSLR